MHGSGAERLINFIPIFIKLIFSTIYAIEMYPFMNLAFSYRNLLLRPNASMLLYYNDIALRETALTI